MKIRRNAVLISSFFLFWLLILGITPVQSKVTTTSFNCRITAILQVDEGRVWYPGGDPETSPLGRQHIRNSYHRLTIEGDIEGILEFWSNTNWEIIDETYTAVGVGWGPHRFKGTWQGDSPFFAQGDEVEFEGILVLKFILYPYEISGKFTSHGSYGFDGMLLKGTLGLGSTGLEMSGVIKG